MLAGAVYNPLEVIDPFGPTVPLATQFIGVVFVPLAQTSQLTPVLEVPVTVAVNCSVSVAATVAVEGVTVTRTPESTMTMKVPNLVISTQLVATTKKTAGWGGAAGAV